MRNHLPGILIALLIFQSSGALADEVRYKNRPQPQAQERQQSQNKPQPPTPRERPPDKYHPIKEPQPRRPDPPSPPPPPYTPPTPQPRQDPWCPPEPPCCDEVYIDPMPPIYDPAYIPSPDFDVNILDVVARRLRLMEIEGFAGEVALGWSGRLYFERFYGDLYKPVTRGYYDIAGVTKAFTAWAVYELVEAKKLRLGTTLGDLFPNAPPDKRGITIEQLLGNTSGLDNTYLADGETDRDIAVSNLLAQPLAHEPGAEFTFSDDGYIVLAAAIEVASGMAYESWLLDSNVISSDMKQTSFWGEIRNQRAHWGARGSSGVLSTAHDLFNWATRFLEGDESVVEQITRPRLVTEEGEGFAQGWFWTDPDSDEPVLWTSGAGYLNHNTMVVVYPSRAMLVVTSDRFHGDVPWSERVANTLESVLLRGDEPSVSPIWTTGMSASIHPATIQR